MIDASGSNLLNHRKLLLASTSPYRAALLARLHIPFATATPHVDESPLPAESPADTALRLAVAKARAVRADHPDSLIIGSDQVADLDGMAIGKPGNRERAVAQLKAVRGKRVIFHTAVCLLNATTGQLRSQLVSTAVTMRTYTDQEIDGYLDKEPAFDCAGSAKSEGLGIALIASQEGSDPNALVGLPLIALVNMLHEENFPVLIG
jgi:septum formation protein